MHREQSAAGVKQYVFCDQEQQYLGKSKMQLHRPLQQLLVSPIESLPVYNRNRFA